MIGIRSPPTAGKSKPQAEHLREWGWMVEPGSSPFPGKKKTADLLAQTDGRRGKPVNTSSDTTSIAEEEPSPYTVAPYDPAEALRTTLETAHPLSVRLADSGELYEAVNAFVDSIVEDQWCVLHKDYSRLLGIDSLNDQAHRRLMDAAYALAKKRLAERVADAAEHAFHVRSQVVAG